MSAYKYFTTHENNRDKSLDPGFDIIERQIDRKGNKSGSNNDHDSDIEKEVYKKNSKGTEEEIEKPKLDAKFLEHFEDTKKNWDQISSGLDSTQKLNILHSIMEIYPFTKYRKFIRDEILLFGYGSENSKIVCLLKSPTYEETFEPMSGREHKILFDTLQEMIDEPIMYLYSCPVFYNTKRMSLPYEMESIVEWFTIERLKIINPHTLIVVEKKFYDKMFYSLNISRKYPNAPSMGIPKDQTIITYGFDKYFSGSRLPSLKNILMLPLYYYKKGENIPMPTYNEMVKCTQLVVDYLNEIKKDGISRLRNDDDEKVNKKRKVTTKVLDPKKKCKRITDLFPIIENSVNGNNLLIRLNLKVEKTKDTSATSIEKESPSILSTESSHIHLNNKSDKIRNNPLLAASDYAFEEGFYLLNNKLINLLKNLYQRKFRSSVISMIYPSG